MGQRGDLAIANDREGAETGTHRSPSERRLEPPPPLSPSTLRCLERLASDRAATGALTKRSSKTERIGKPSGGA